MADQLEREKCFKDRYLETTFKKKKKNKDYIHLKFYSIVVLRERIFLNKY